MKDSVQMLRNCSTVLDESPTDVAQIRKGTELTFISTEFHL